MAHNQEEWTLMDEGGSSRDNYRSQSLQSTTSSNAPRTILTECVLNIIGTEKKRRLCEHLCTACASRAVLELLPLDCYLVRKTLDTFREFASLFSADICSQLSCPSRYRSLIRWCEAIASFSEALAPI